MPKDTDDMWLFRSYADEDDVAAVTEVIERGTWWAKGKEIDEFEELIAEWTDREHGIAFNSGTSALYANLLANDITNGEVIVPSFTFQATANAVVAAGAKPVFADIERGSLALNPDDVAEKAGPETQAIMPIHFAGDVCAGIRDLGYIAQDHGAALIEDACHSPGAKLDGEPVGSFGKSATFSFCFNKIITTGEGGMVVTDDDDLRERLELIRSHGCDENGEYVTYGHNFRMATMAAALGVSQAKKLDYIISRRREMAGYLNEQLADLVEVHCPVFPEERDSVYQLYNIRFDDPSIQPALRDHLSDRGVPTRITYDPVHLSRYYSEELGCEPGDLPVTEDVSEKILTLPFHLDLSDDDLDRIATGVRSFFE